MPTGNESLTCLEQTGIGSGVPGHVRCTNDGCGRWINRNKGTDGGTCKLARAWSAAVLPSTVILGEHSLPSSAPLPLPPAAILGPELGAPGLGSSFGPGQTLV